MGSQKVIERLICSVLKPDPAQRVNPGPDRPGTGTESG